MLKVVVFDFGYGGEIFADRLEDDLPIIKIVRAIDWRHAEEAYQNKKTARKLAEANLKPHIGKVDLIILANYLLSITSLKFFQHKYKDQAFLGLKLNHPMNFRYRTAILATSAVAKTITHKQYAKHLHAVTHSLDDWPLLIDDGELGHAKIRRDLKPLAQYKPEQLVLTCAQFVDLESELRRIFGHNTKIIDNFDQTIRDAGQLLKIRGALKKQK